MQFSTCFFRYPSDALVCVCMSVYVFVPSTFYSSDLIRCFSFFFFACYSIAEMKIMFSFDKSLCLGILFPYCRCGYCCYYCVEYIRFLFSPFFCIQTSQKNHTQNSEIEICLYVLYGIIIKHVFIPLCLDMK